MVTKKAASKSPTTTPDKVTLNAHEVILSATCQNAIGMDAWGKFAGAADLGGLIKGLSDRIDKIQAGNMDSVEAMLYGQAMTLQTIFTIVGSERRSRKNWAETVPSQDDVRTQGAGAVPGHPGGAGRDQESPACLVRQAGQHKQRAAAGEQRHRGHRAG